MATPSHSPARGKIRRHGTLTKWNDDRGFGFIAPPGGAPDVFVHISAFPRDGRRPQLGELISFEIEAGKDGRQRAVQIMRPGQQQSVRIHHRSMPRQPFMPRAVTKIGLALACSAVLAAFVYSRVAGRATIPEASPEAERLVNIQEDTAEERSRFSCDGRTHCSQMTSCGEATWFIRNCPGTEMDGDSDGVPCEQQWCN
jgi:cold shock CspA family protein